MDELAELRRKLSDFAVDPHRAWGKPCRRYTDPTGCDPSFPRREQPTTPLYNQARRQSGTYTLFHKIQFEQDRNFSNNTGNALPKFGGNPNSLPPAIPERRCWKCHKPFQSLNRERNVRCFDCELKRICPVYPPWNILEVFEVYDWRLLVFTSINNIAKKVTYWWASPEADGIACHQGLIAYFNTFDELHSMTAATVVDKACYILDIDLATDSVIKRLSYELSVTEEVMVSGRVRDWGNRVGLAIFSNKMPIWMTLAY